MPAPKTVDAYIKANPKWSSSISKLRALLLEFDFDEQIKWMFPTYSIDDKNLVSICATKSYVGLWFFQGGLLEDKMKVLVSAQKGKTKAMRQWRFESESQIKKTILKKYIKETIKNHKAGKAIKSEKPNSNPVNIPELLEKNFKKDKKLKAAFEKLSLGKRREYALHIGNAKQESTKLRRLEKMIPMIKSGKSLNDKYTKK